MNDVFEMNSTQEKTFADIYNTYYKKSLRFVKSYVHDDLAAEDITSESLIKLWEYYKPGKVDEITPLLLTILKNNSLAFLRHEEIKRTAIANIEDWHNYELALRISSLEACNPDSIFESDVMKIIKDILDSMPAQTRQIFIMSRFEDKSNAEIAKELNITTKGVEYHITKVLKVMRVALKDYLPFFLFFLS